MKQKSHIGGKVAVAHVQCTDDRGLCFRCWGHSCWTKSHSASWEQHRIPTRGAVWSADDIIAWTVVLSYIWCKIIISSVFQPLPTYSFIVNPPLSWRKIGIFRVIQKSCPLKPSWCLLVTNQSGRRQDASCPCQCHFVGMRAAWHRLPVGWGDGRETSSCFPSLISQQLGRNKRIAHQVSERSFI